MAERDARRCSAQGRDHRGPGAVLVRACGSETHFTNGYDPNPRVGRVFAFPQLPSPAIPVTCKHLTLGAG